MSPAARLEPDDFLRTGISLQDSPKHDLSRKTPIRVPCRRTAVATVAGYRPGRVLPPERQSIALAIWLIHIKNRSRVLVQSLPDAPTGEQPRPAFPARSGRPRWNPRQPTPAVNDGWKSSLFSS